ncbi:MAG TPA: hypothetical protein VFA47_00790, partial [Candidatus Manganitrophaceae bacterium]|nr:hypothetical protein [Candidatus Manganitrophaceae bacterium]
LLSRMKEGKPWQILLLSDHPTIVSTRDHAADPVPFLLCRGLDQPAEARVFSETEAAKRENLWPEGHRLMDHFLS